MNIMLPYGKSEITLKIADETSVRILNKELAPPLASVSETLRAAMSNPIGSPPFHNLFRETDRVVILIPDVTRKAGLRQVLPVLLTELEKLGISRYQVVLLVALGMHRLMSRDELTSMIGKETLDRHQVIQHDCHSIADNAHLGVTERGSPIVINRLALPPNKVVVVGSITHHYFSGFGGGAKMLCPGVAGFDSILATHRLTLDPNSPDYFHTCCKPGILDGNPVREEIERIGEQVPPAFLINTVLSPEGGIIALFAGHWQKAFRQGCRYVSRHFEIPIDRRADCVIAAGGGFPKDMNLIQSHKGMEYATNALKPGGSLLYLAECRDGVGSETFLPWFEAETCEEMFDNLLKKYTVNGHTALSMRRKTLGFNVHICSELSPGTVEKIGAKPAKNPQIWLNYPRGFIYIIPRSGNFTLKQSGVIDDIM
ncbi:MAG: hypothetical protein B6244_11480 [Candidatus Cloacimonetes bacterium 4572_55]|nr:MAG: hypothetical protein B6244_11480 [Candidatus Cloacimonetes bacterium 4572_55]